MLPPLTIIRVKSHGIGIGDFSWTFMAALDEIPTAQFDASHPLGRYLVSTGLLSKAWDASTRAQGKPFVQYDIEDVVFIAFSGSDVVNDFLLGGNTEFGEGSINTGNDLFKYLKDNNGEPAVVHEGLLHGFLNLIRNSKILEKVEGCLRQKQRVVLTGHCLGGAMAVFATFWMLGNARKIQGKRPRLPFCVTFGSPLIGDQRLAQAISREKWSGQFCHVVSKHDVIPRVLLAPFPSFHHHLKALIPCIYSVIEHYNNHCHQQFFYPLSREHTTIFLATILQHTKIAANEGNCGKINQSPYKPFGYYLFCSEKGAACMESSTAVLQMFCFTLQDIDMCSWAFLMEHIDYGESLERNLRNLISGGTIGEGYSDAQDPYEMGIAMALEAAGVETQNSAAREVLMNTGRIGIRPSLNSAKLYVQSAKVQGARVEIEWYKASCQRQGLGYYDSFKSSSSQKDFRANLNRIKISRFWNELIEMVETNQLPDDFHLRSKWVYAGTYYRQLVEPLDIALYYRLRKHERCGHYLQGKRPPSYIVLEKWLEDSNLNKENFARRELAVLTQDSCFWARVEEARDWLETIKEHKYGAVVSELMDKIQGFVNRVWKLIEARDISYDVLLEEGSFMKWWRDYRDICGRLPPCHPRLMELQLIENEIRKLCKAKETQNMEL